MMPRLVVVTTREQNKHLCVNGDEVRDDKRGVAVEGINANSQSLIAAN